MIHRISSDFASFKNQTFRSGLNLLVCHKGATATSRQTRNRAGKSSLVALVHFLMGANVDKGLFGQPGLAEATFSMELDINGDRILVERCPAAASKLVVSGSDFRSWAVEPAHGPEKTRQISNTDWKKVLGQSFFDLPSDVGRFGPSFRSLFSYFARQEGEGGFLSFKSHAKMQQPVDQQVALSYLIGLDWTIAQRFQEVREQEKAFKGLKALANSKGMTDLIPSSANLRTKLAVSEKRIEELRNGLSGFQVHEQYKELEREASQLTQRLLWLADENALDEQLIKELEAATQTESAPPPENLAAVYAEAGVVLPQAVVKRFDEVQAFHASVIGNRRLHLATKLKELSQAIAQRDAEKEQLDARRAQVMKILESHGALEHFQELQSELSRVEGRAEQVRVQFEASEKLELEKGRLKSERSVLHNRLLEDFREHVDVLTEAIQIFETFSERLYEEAGSLELDHSDNGPTFEVRIQGQRSKGIKNMQIFCFDLMLMTLCHQRGIGPGFLIHDSHLFDGVDPRQTVAALTLGAEAAEQNSFQYIVILNSDILETEDFREKIPDGFLARYQIDSRLTDATEDGGLFGVRF